MLAHLSALTGRLDIPLNADFENGFADDPEGVARHVVLAVETGVAGLSVEDSTGLAPTPLYDFDLAVARIAAARAAIDAVDPLVVLTARSEGFICGRPDLTETIRRLQAYAAAGADCLYAPGLREESQITAVIQAVAPKPVNILTPGLPVSTLAALGTRRISVGGLAGESGVGRVHADRTGHRGPRKLRRLRTRSARKRVEPAFRGPRLAQTPFRWNHLNGDSLR